MWFLRLYDTNLVELISSYLVLVGTGPVPFCAGRDRSESVPNGAGADRIRVNIVRNAVFDFFSHPDSQLLLHNFFKLI